MEERLQERRGRCRGCKSRGRQNLTTSGKKLPVNSINHTSKVFLFVAVKMGEISQANGCERRSRLCGVAATAAKINK